MRQPYPGYQSSRVEWLGDLPEHWEVRRLGAALAETVGGGTPDTGNESYWADDDEEGLPWVAIADMSAGGEVATTAKRVTSLGRAAARLRPLPAGTIIYSMYASVGAVARLRMSAATNQAILGLVPGEMIESSFLYWWLTGVRKPVLSLTRDNTQSNLNAETVCKIPLALPPLDEQRSISGFLDRETAEIDTLVERKRLLLERLAEYRTALITRTVTKGLPPEATKKAGLNPNPPLKPSGVEWLGEVPEHWDARRISSLARPGKNSFIDGDWVELPYITDSGVRLIQTGNIGIGAYREQGYRYIGESSFDELHCTEVDPGDVLICRLADPVGRACRAPSLGVRMITSVDVCILKPSDEHSAAYLTYLLSSKRYLNYVDSLVRGGTRDRISRSMLGAIRVPTPPYEEQRAIAAFLDGQTGRVDDLRSRVETAIERLQEYRSGADYGGCDRQDRCAGS